MRRGATGAPRAARRARPAPTPHRPLDRVTTSTERLSVRCLPPQACEAALAAARALSCAPPAAQPALARPLSSASQQPAAWWFNPSAPGRRVSPAAQHIAQLAAAAPPGGATAPGGGGTAALTKGAAAAVERAVTRVERVRRAPALESE